MIARTVSRRAVLQGGALAALSPGLAAAQPAAAPAEERWRGLKVGVASYTFRKLPVEATIRGIQRVGLRYVSIKDAHLPLKSTPEERKAVAAKFTAAGITPLSCGVIDLPSDEARARVAFEYARDIGVPTIVCSPDPAALPLLDRLVKETGIRLAIHNHGPGDRRFPSPFDVWNAVQSHDERIGLCIDVGHTARAGVDPAEAIRKCRARLYDLHFKDLNSTRPNGSPVEGGRGALDQRAILGALVEIRYPHLMSFEYEKDADDPLPGLAESVGYARGILAGVRA